MLRTYWVLAVVGAFLLVTLTGEPSALKTVYLVGFFIFMITYQVRGVVRLLKLILYLYVHAYNEIMASHLSPPCNTSLAMIIQ
jgi:hypothetical protein